MKIFGFESSVVEIVLSTFLEKTNIDGDYRCKHHRCYHNGEDRGKGDILTFLNQEKIHVDSVFFSSFTDI